MKNQRQVINAETNRVARVPMYLIYGCGMPVACNDFSMALEKARELSERGYNKDEEFRIFDTMLGSFPATYKNGKLVA